jgi:S-adenosylmethionine:tRNA ribosyltransferase-isomerase
MKPAVWPREERLGARLLHVDPEHESLVDRHIRELPGLLRAGDLLVVNDAATLPASLQGKSAAGPVEVRLVGQGPTSREWHAVLFGKGSWRQRTEDRAAPPVMAIGTPIEFADGLRATVRAISSTSPRLVELSFDRDGAALWTALYRAGRLVQYSYLAGPLALWHVQTSYGARPWAVEMPSAGWALGASSLREMRRLGIRIASLTHAAGLSSTGDASLDALLPLPERFDIPAATVHEIERTRGGGGRIVAVGTTVVRALEGCAVQNGGRLRAGLGVTDLRVGHGFQLRIVDGVLTGMHEPGTSHFDLLRAFAPGALLETAYRHAEAAGYLGHEFGDLSLVLAA